MEKNVFIVLAIKPRARNILEKIFGRPTGTRTPNQLIKSQLLYRLSYRPVPKRLKQVFLSDLSSMEQGNLFSGVFALKDHCSKYLLLKCVSIHFRTNLLNAFFHVFVVLAVGSHQALMLILFFARH